MKITIKIIKAILLFIFISSAISAQNNFLKIVSSSESFNGSTISQNTDHSYIITGTAWTANGEQVFLMKTDSFANVEWTSYYDHVLYSNGKSGLQFQNGYIISGTIVTNNGNFSLLFKTDSLGAIEWERAYGTFSFSENGMKMILDRDKILLGGMLTHPGPVFSNLDFGLKMIDSLGNILWSKKYGGPASDILIDFFKTNDEGFILCGISTSPNDSLDWGILIVKTDSMGTMQWTKTYQNGYYHHSCKIVQDDNGEYTIAGNYYEQPFLTSYLLHIDSIGQQIWAKQYHDMVYNCIQKTNDAGHVVGGYLSDSMGTILNGAVVTTDSAGNLLDARNYTDTISTIWDQIINNNEYGYTLVGHGDEVTERWEIILKVDSTGFLECPHSNFSPLVTNITFIDTSIAIESDQNDSTIIPALNKIPIQTIETVICQTNSISNEIMSEEIEIYPNPFSSQINIKLSLTSDDIIINIYNVLGKIVFSSIQKSTELINLVSLSPGIYFVDIQWGNKKVRKKIIKI